MTKWAFEIHLVDVAAAHLGGCQVTGLNQFVHDAMHRSFADPNFLGNLREADIGLLGDTDHDVAVVGKKGPTWDIRTRASHCLR